MYACFWPVARPQCFTSRESVLILRKFFLQDVDDLAIAEVAIGNEEALACSSFLLNGQHMRKRDISNVNPQVVA